MRETGKTALIIGGGLAGMEAALRIGQAGFHSVLIEKEAVLGGTVLKLKSSFPRWEDPLDLVHERVEQAEMLLRGHRDDRDDGGRKHTPAKWVSCLVKGR